MNKTILILGIIFLLVGVSCSSAISVNDKTNTGNNIQLKEDNTSFEESYEEVIVSIYGIGKTDEIKVLLTNEQADKLEKVFNELDFKIRNSKSKSQTIDCINWAFDSFQEFNLFNRQDERIIKKLLISFISNSKVKYGIEPVNETENYNCTIAGFLLQDYHHVRFYWGYSPMFFSILEYMYNNPIIGILLLPFLIPPLALYAIIHEILGYEYGAYGTVGGLRIDTQFNDYNWYPTECNILTKGTNGVVTWEGKQYGQIRSFMTRYSDWLTWWDVWHFVGIESFTGIKLTFVGPDVIYILGNARHVALAPTAPPFN